MQETTKPTIYQACKERGLEMDSHSSDLYLRLGDEAWDMVRKHYLGARHKTFLARKGQWWIDLPFCVDPFWEA